MARPRLSDFTDAPLGAYVCEEGWLVYGDQAWTLAEWEYAGLGNYGFRRPRGPNGRPRIYATAKDRRDAEYRRLRAKQLGIPVSEVVVRPWRKRAVA